MGKIIQIIPTLPPNITGVGDFGYLLSKGLSINYHTNSVFFISDTNYKQNKIDDFEVYTFSKNYFSFYRSLKNLIITGSDRIILQYVNYAYQKRGVPYYIPIVLNRIKKEFKEVKIIINFHELYAKGHFPSSSFFLYPVQKYIFELLIDVGDVFFTSTNKFKCIIKKYDETNSKITTSLPVFSNVGELVNNIPLKNRGKQIVVFGTHRVRYRLYKNNFESLVKICLKFGFNKIIDIGEKIDLKFNLPSNIILQQTGKLNYLEVSKFLSSSSAAAINYPAEYLAKSGVFAAYAAHALPVFCFTKMNENDDGLLDGINFISYANINNNLDLDKISKNVFDWYNNHSIFNHLNYYKRLITE